LTRIIKFVSAFLGVAVFIFILVFGINRSSFETMFDNREGLAEGSEWVEMTYSLQGLTQYIAEQPALVSISSIKLDNPGNSIQYQQDEPRPMGTLSNFILMIAYADAIESGIINPDETIKWDQISRYQLPGIGASIHRNTFRAGRNRDWIDPDGNITIENALNLLSKHNSLALSDYLLSHLGRNQIDEFFNQTELQFTDKPVPFSGLLITLAPSIQNQSSQGLLQTWGGRFSSDLENSVYENTERFLNGDEREEWMEILENQRLGLNFMQERDLLALYPATTASEMTRILQQIVSGEFISERVSNRVLDWLRYPMEEQTIRRNFLEYGAIYDNRIGLLNGIDFGVSQYTGETTVQAIFFDRLHIAVWFHMSSNHMHQDFQQRLIWDPALIETMKTVAEETN
jgi:hypothetical protein